MIADILYSVKKLKKYTQLKYTFYQEFFDHGTKRKTEKILFVYVRAWMRERENRKRERKKERVRMWYGKRET